MKEWWVVKVVSQQKKTILRVQIKYPTTPQMRHCTTLWNVCAQNWPCSRAEWSKLLCKTQPFETVAEKYLSSYVSTILLTDKKIFYSGHTEKPKESPTICSCRNKEERRQDKTCTWSTLDSHWWHQSASHKWSRKHKFDTWQSWSQGVMVMEGCYYNVMLL